MDKIDLTKEIIFKHAALRFFSKGEFHCERYCRDDVLLMVFEGLLVFTEDGKDYEIGPGEYHIQRSGGFQTAKISSQMPKYLYVHFSGEWTDSEEGLEIDGTFDFEALMPLMTELDRLGYSNAPYILKAGKFYEILSHLYKKEKKLTLADEIAEYIEKEYKNRITLENIEKEFKFSKNHIINVFKKKYKMTPVQYANCIRIRYAERLLERTSDSAEFISNQCGFNNYSHFFRLFKEENKISPMEWRNKKRIHPCEI